MYPAGINSFIDASSYIQTGVQFSSFNRASTVADSGTDLVSSVSAARSVSHLGSSSGYALASVSVSDFSQHQEQNIVFIASDLDEHEILVQGIQPGTEVYILDEHRDSIEQITDVLAGRTGVNSLEIFTHAEAGSLDVGTTALNMNNLSAYSNDLQSWRSALAQDADILLQGCNLVASADGRALVQELSHLTGADLAASIDYTGSTALGGNWVLEYSVGAIETESLLNDWAKVAYDHVFATLTVNNTDDLGPGSLRQAILDANATPEEDLITFDGGPFADTTPDTITLTSGELSLEENVVISGPGAGALTISGNNSQRVLSVQAGVVAAIAGFTIADGQAVDGGGVANFGSLSVFDTTLSNNNASQIGGGIANYGGLLLDGANLNNNTSAIDGGGIFNLGNVEMVFSDLKNNDAQVNGGSIFNFVGSLMTIDNSLFGLNTAGQDGGSIFNLGEMDILFSVLQDSSAGRLGGGIANFGTINSIDDSLIKANRVLSGSGAGGGLFNGGSTNITDTAIIGNFSAGRGGGIFNNSGALLTLRDNSILTSNNAIGDGGGIFNDTNGSVIVSNSTIISNIFSDLSGDFTSEGGNTIGSNAGSTGFPSNNTVGDTIIRPVEGFGFGFGGGITGGVVTGGGAGLPFPGLPFPFS